MPVRLKEKEKNTQKQHHVKVQQVEMFFSRLCSADLSFSIQWRTLVNLLMAVHCIIACPPLVHCNTQR